MNEFAALRGELVPRLFPAENAHFGVWREHRAFHGDSIWVGGDSSRLTLGNNHDTRPIWSNDGTRVVFTSPRDGTDGIYQKLSNGAGEEELLLNAAENEDALDLSWDDRYLLYQISGQSLGGNPPTASIWVLPLFGEKKPFPFVKSDFSEQHARFSPNGRWVAYSSNESGRQEIYVRPFPSADSKWPVSTNGGIEPIWRGDGKELFYLGADRKLMAVDVRTDSSIFQSEAPKPLFEVQVRSNPPSYAVTADGQRFIVHTPLENFNSSITVVLNWTAQLKKQ